MSTSVQVDCTAPYSSLVEQGTVQQYTEEHYINNWSGVVGTSPFYGLVGPGANWQQLTFEDHLNNATDDNWKRSAFIDEHYLNNWNGVVITSLFTVCFDRRLVCRSPPLALNPFPVLIDRGPLGLTNSLRFPTLVQQNWKYIASLFTGGPAVTSTHAQMDQSLVSLCCDRDPYSLLLGSGEGPVEVVKHVVPFVA